MRTNQFGKTKIVPNSLNRCCRRRRTLLIVKYSCRRLLFVYGASKNPAAIKFPVPSRSEGQTGTLCGSIVGLKIDETTKRTKMLRRCHAAGPNGNSSRMGAVGKRNRVWALTPTAMATQRHRNNHPAVNRSAGATESASLTRLLRCLASDCVAPARAAKAARHRTHPDRRPARPTGLPGFRPAPQILDQLIRLPET